MWQIMFLTRIIIIIIDDSFNIQVHVHACILISVLNI